MSDRVVAAYPLTWPDGWKRSSRRERSRFGEHTVRSATVAILEELRRLHAPESSIMISSNVKLRLDGFPLSNQRPPEDPGVSVWFSLRSRKGDDRRVLACDRFDRVEHNLHAIALHIAAMRAIERYGVGSIEQAFRGYVALPGPESGWRSVLGDCRTVDDVSTAFRVRARAAHPDAGGSDEQFDELSKAREAAIAEITGGTKSRGVTS